MAITNAQQARQIYKKGSKPVEQAGVMNYMPSEMVTVPKIAKSSPDTPTAKLAYITPEEQDILVDLNLYGSLDGKPNRGPGGIPSLEGDFGSPTGQASTGAGTGGTYSGGSGDDKVSRGRDLDYQMSGGKTDSTIETYRGGKNIGDDFFEGKVTLPIILAYRRGNVSEREFLENSFNNKNNTISSKQI